MPNQNEPTRQPTPEEQQRMIRDQIRGGREHEAQDAPAPEGGVAGPDATSGGGNASGTPDAETGMRAEKIINRGNPDTDKNAVLHQPGQVRMQEESE